MPFFDRLGRDRFAALAVFVFVVFVGHAAGLAAATAEDRVIELAKQRDAGGVRAALAARADANAAEADGTTALHWAAHLDDTATMDVLLAAGADARAANRYGVTPLDLAAVNGNADIIARLLDSGADPNTASAEGQTVLMTAARTGKAGAVEVLLTAGAEIDRKDLWKGQTALMWAVAQGHAEAVRTLLRHGADVALQSEGGFSPLLFAVRGGDRAIVRALIETGADVNDAMMDGTTALGLAILNAHYALAAFLVEQGADPTAELPGGTALHLAVITRDYEFGEIYRPAPPGSGDLDALDLIRVLLAHEADPNNRMATRFPRQGSFDNNFLSLIGSTPFLLAARVGDAEAMRLLAEHGADPHLPTEQGVTPLMVAAGMGYVQGQSIGSEAARVEAVELLLDLSADIDAATDDGETVMHGAATGGANSVVQLLAERGAALNIKGKSGWTPLSIADGTRSNFRFWPETATLLRTLLARSLNMATGELRPLTPPGERSQAETGPVAGAGAR